MDITGILAITFIFGGGTLFLLAISPVGRAIAARIQGKAVTADDVVQRLDAANQAVLDELEDLRRDVVEVQERLDFAERLLAQQRQAALPSEGSPGER
jgi:DNA repair exonuclease SbcCD ATPase subunit